MCTEPLSARVKQQRSASYSFIPFDFLHLFVTFVCIWYRCCFKLVEYVQIMQVTFGSTLCNAGSVILWITETVWPHFREWFSPNKRGLICQNSVRWLAHREDDWWRVFPPSFSNLLNTLWILWANSVGCATYKWVSVWFKYDSAMWLNLGFVIALLCVRHSLCYMHKLSAQRGSWKNGQL